MRRRRGEKLLRPVHPNAGITVAVRRRLVALIDEMAASYQHWLEAQWRERPPVMAADASPAAELERELKKLGVRFVILKNTKRLMICLKC